jgi:hypothetical protein
MQRSLQQLDKEKKKKKKGGVFPRFCFCFYLTEAEAKRSGKQVISLLSLAKK